MNGWRKRWRGDPRQLQIEPQALPAAIAQVCRAVYVVDLDGRTAVTHLGTMVCGGALADDQTDLPLLGFAAPLHPSDLGDGSFKRDLGVRYAYVVGAMANGITSVDMVMAAGKAGMVGFFGAGGLALTQVQAAVHLLREQRGNFPFGFNLIHSPNDPALEAAIVDLYLQNGIRLVSASAYLGVTLPLVYYRVKGIHQAPDGRIICPNHIVAKVSRIEVARKFFAPPPEKILEQLLHQGKINRQEAQLARHIPLAQDMTAEADSGGHTDNRPALALLPTFLALRDEAALQYNFQVPLRVGLAGGIATPAAVAAAFAMGAAFVLTGSINQSCVEADTSELVRNMLVQAQQADVTMAPAADMFELGAKVQVLKRGTMFAMRGAKLYELYRAYARYDEIPESTRRAIERDLLRCSFDQAWSQTCRYFQSRDVSQIERAEKNPKHKMALVFRSYLGQSSLWAKTGDPDRQMDFQIWCGPAMGAFNAWAKGSFLEETDQRRTALLALNLLYGATGLIRCHSLGLQGVCLPREATLFRPLPLDEIQRRLES